MPPHGPPYEHDGRALPAQPAMDRLQSAAYELVVEGESYRQKPRRGKPAGPAGSD